MGLRDSVAKDLNTTDYERRTTVYKTRADWWHLFLFWAKA